MDKKQAQEKIAELLKHAEDLIKVAEDVATEAGVKIDWISPDGRWIGFMPRGQSPYENLEYEEACEKFEELEAAWVALSEEEQTHTPEPIHPDCDDMYESPYGTVGWTNSSMNC